MTGQTPHFNKTLDGILKDLKPHAQKCAECRGEFSVYKEDIDFYRMARVPPPSRCPLCRKKRRLGHLMRMPKFFKRPCRAPGHIEDVVTVFPPQSPHKTYDFSYWWSDAWEGGEYARISDETKPFFDQFRSLFFDVPLVPLDHDPNAVGSDYSVGGMGGTNAYYAAGSYHSENTSYCFNAQFSRDLVDCSQVSYAELCYEAVYSLKCSRCRFIVECSDCLDSLFLFNCRNCSHCFLSSNLRNKSYVFENVQLSKDAYEEKIRSVNLGNRDEVRALRNRFAGLMEKSVRRATWNIGSVSAVGDQILNSKDCFFSFNILAGSENIRYSDGVSHSKDVMDAAHVSDAELLYESVVAHGSRNYFSMYLRNCSFAEYCANCQNCHYCFGCAGLKNKKFHIFNTPYGEEEYWKTVDGSKTAMLQRGEYGEFFPLTLGLLPYQSSNAQKYFPLDAQEAGERGIPWYNEPDSPIPAGARIRRAPDEVPADIRDVTDDILNDVILCEASKRPFRIVKAELDFYRRMNLPLPTKHPWQRLTERTALEHGLWLYPFHCPKCGTDTRSVYTPEQQRRMSILCEACYLKEVA